MRWRSSLLLVVAVPRLAAAVPAASCEAVAAASGAAECHDALSLLQPPVARMRNLSRSGAAAAGAATHNVSAHAGATAGADSVEAMSATGVIGLVRDTIAKEIVFEVGLHNGSMTTEGSTKSKVVLAVLEGLVVTSFIGCDRCYMSQPCIGCFKALTFGGFGVWALFDYVVVMANMLGGSDAIDIAGFQNQFQVRSVQPAFVISVVSLGVLLCGLTAQFLSTRAGDKVMSRVLGDGDPSRGDSQQ